MKLSRKIWGFTNLSTAVATTQLFYLPKTRLGYFVMLAMVALTGSMLTSLYNTRAAAEVRVDTVARGGLIERVGVLEREVSKLTSNLDLLNNEVARNKSDVSEWTAKADPKLAVIQFGIKGVVNLHSAPGQPADDAVLGIEKPTVNARPNVNLYYRDVLFFNAQLLPYPGWDNTKTYK